MSGLEVAGSSFRDEDTFLVDVSGMRDVIDRLLREAHPGDDPLTVRSAGSSGATRFVLGFGGVLMRAGDSVTDSHEPPGECIDLT